MIHRLDSGTITDLCRGPLDPANPARCARAVREFGPLAQWWLHPKALEAAVSHQPAYRCFMDRPALPGSLGSCWVVFARQQPLPLLRPAFLLPLRWHPRSQHGRGLPGPLRRLADEVLGQLRGVPAVAQHDWGLHLHDGAGLTGMDLTALNESDIGVLSGWAALAGGLLLAAEERLPNPHIWASAAWHPEFGIDGVDGIDGKLELAREWEVKQFFLPAEHQRQALEWARAYCPGLSSPPLLPVARDPVPSSLLRPFLEQLGVPPAPEGPWEKRVAHYRGISRTGADKYHWSHLLRTIVCRCGEKFRLRYPELKAKRLITVVSTSPSVVVLAPASLQVQSCLLLYEEADQKVKMIVPILEEFLRSVGIQPRSEPIRVGSREIELETIAPRVREFCAGVAADEVIYDMTPGYKPLSLALDEIASPESWRIYCRHEQLPDRNVDPGTEHYDAWQGPRTNGARDTIPCAFVSS